jgi:hypothetical protein
MTDLNDDYDEIIGQSSVPALNLEVQQYVEIWFPKYGDKFMKSEKADAVRRILREYLIPEKEAEAMIERAVLRMTLETRDTIPCPPPTI